MESASAARYKIMEELPLTFDDVSEPSNNVNIEDSSSTELDAELESEVAAVEQRDANRFSDRVERTHRARRQPRLSDGRQSRRAQHGRAATVATMMTGRTNSPAAAPASSAPASP